jgi:hypothetical protein
MAVPKKRRTSSRVSIRNKFNHKLKRHVFNIDELYKLIKYEENKSKKKK